MKQNPWNRFTSRFVLILSLSFSYFVISIITSENFYTNICILYFIVKPFMGLVSNFIIWQIYIIGGICWSAHPMNQFFLCINIDSSIASISHILLLWRVIKSDTEFMKSLNIFLIFMLVLLFPLGKHFYSNSLAMLH